MTQSSRDIDPFWAICGQVVVTVCGAGAVAVPGEYVRIEGFEDYQFVLHRGFSLFATSRIFLHDEYRVSEATTGCSVTHLEPTKEAALAAAQRRLAEAGPERLAAAVTRSPKLWTGLQCHYADPDDSWKVLLYNGLPMPGANDRQGACPTHN